MDFSDALKALKDGKKVAKNKWEGRYVFLFRCEGFMLGSELDEVALCQKDHLAIKTPENNLYPWVPNPDDLLSDHWVIVE